MSVNTVSPELDPIVELRGIDKSFGGVHALREVDFAITPATIIGLVGENGAGKSTLLKVLSGTYRADAGEIFIDGVSQSFYGPAAARRAGISMVTQELSLFPNLTVAANISIGREPTVAGFTSGAKSRQAAADALSLIQSSISPDAVVRDLPFADRQNVEIAKALVDDPRVLVLDEPTSGLREAEVDALMNAMRRLRDAGRSVIFITHRMSELFAICDSFMVMKDGVAVGTRMVGQTTPDELISMMVGRDIKSLFPPKANVDRTPDTEKLALRGFRVGHSVGPVDLDLFDGEILGIAGLAGNGQNELLEGIAGLRRSSGTMWRSGDPKKRTSPYATPGSAVRAGYSLVPEDRKGQGLVLSFPVFKNVTLAGLRQISRFGFLSQAKEYEATRHYIETLDIRTPGESAITVGLSGGNQQKVVLAKALDTKPAILLLSDPTRGIDVGTKQEIYVLVRQLASDGVGIVFLSTDVTEIVGLCDRVLVMSHRQIVAELAGADITEEKITRAAFEGDQ